MITHRLKPAQNRSSYSVSTMAKSGLNLKDLLEFLNPAFALINENYFVQNNRGLSKRKGLIKAKEIAGGYPVTMFEYWNGYWMFAYNTTLAALNPTTGTHTVVKDDWNTDDKFSGAPYGAYFFTGNIGNKIHYVTVAAGVFTITEIAAAPMAKIIKAIGPRLYASVGNDVYFCNVDDGSDPPFQTWTVAETATAGGLVTFRNGGEVNSICSLGDIVVVFGDTGKWAFRLNVQNNGAGTVVKVEEIVIDRVDMGGASGAITTPKGLFYTNSAGLWQLMSLGQTNIKFSDQEGLTSVNLGTDYFKDIDLSNADLTYYARYGSILLTCAKQAVQNNHVIVYNTEMKAFSTINNWNINRWMSVNNEIYGASSVKTALYHCFAGSTDDGVAISTHYRQELKPAGSVWQREQMNGAYIKGLLHSTASITVAFDIYDITGTLKRNKLKFKWTAQSNINDVDGWGVAEWGKSAWGSDTDNSGMIESFDGTRQFIRNFQRIIVDLKESSKVPHQIDYLVLDSKAKTNIRRRKLTLLT